MTHPMKLPVKLSKGSILLLHLVAAGHVWRDDQGFWVASTERNKRNVHLRIIRLERRGLVRTHIQQSFPELTELGNTVVMANPVDSLIMK